MRHYLIILAIIWFGLGVLVLFRDQILPDDLRARFNHPYAWLVIIVAFTLSLWNLLRWYSAFARQRNARNTDWNPLRNHKTE